ncbi:alpha/beta fold hydrolase [Dyella silvatica]|uniref:alpha/beta fold hydrolase n=1 Tax=Dyella silvatica TaxID=2992128 RepID=UPI00225790E7|nr:alpha/beta hydrolase [Dyella silvatica]
MSIDRFRRGLICLAATLLTLSGAAYADTPAQPAATPSPDAATILRNARKIVTLDGIQSMTTVELGGIAQAISVRGRHRDNPILLFLHGGPSLTSMPASYSYAAPWEEYFTVVQWDQRGAGKTYRANDPDKVAPTMSDERMLADAEALVTWLRKTYHKQKIVLVGHSWGSILGVKLAQRHPDWFYAYVGAGQVVNMQQSEAMGYQATLDAARRDNNAEAVKALESIAPYPDPQLASNPEAVKAAFAKLSVDRQWMSRYGGYFHGEKAGHDPQLMSISPDYDAKDLQARDAGSEFSIPLLWAEMMKVDFTDTTHFDCPVILFHGRHDLIVSATLASRWFATLKAPQKKMIWFEDSSHILFEEESGKFFLSLVQDVLPLTHDAKP